MALTKERIEAAIKAAVSSRGKRKGMLKSSCPPMGTDAAAAWQAIVGHANPHKIGFGHIMTMREEQRELYNHIDNALKGKDVRAMDYDRLALETIGAW